MDTGLTNLGPLPTNFAVNSNCARDLNDVYKYYTTPGSSYFLLQGPVEQTSCYPSSYTANSKQYYSPARCPTGFTSACESHNSAGTIDETVVRCCPTQSKFVCRTQATYDWEETLGCVNPQDSATMTAWTVSQVSGGQTSFTTYTNAIGGVNAYQIQVGFQSTDFASSTTTKTPTPRTHKAGDRRLQDEQTKSTTKSQTRPTAQSTTTKTSSGSSSSHGGSSTKHKKNKLSGGATTGIVIGALAGVASFVALVWFKVRNRQQQQAEDEPDTQKSDVGSAPKDAPETDKRENTAELDTSDVQPSTNTRRLSSS
ncbi:hypothetical protein CIB48_g8517 [Xylaria polymorpha]|nr:hypothetical protein CIB48_g8517 [Xylaria polymorpha]